MTPKEKAQELYSHFRYYVYAYGSEKIKEAAILCIDEIIKANPTRNISTPYPDPLRGFKVETVNDVEYWQQVREELQKL